VLDLTNPESFKFLKHELELAELLAPEHIQKILVGSKADDATNRKISDQEARDYAASQGMQYFEVSARADQNVTQAFETLLRLIEPVLHHWDNIDNTPVATRSGWCTLM
jgi:putative ribosome biogenesis GTPase RsgA